jgi:hypothetical protein
MNALPPFSHSRKRLQVGDADVACSVKENHAVVLTLVQELWGEHFLHLARVVAVVHRENAAALANLRQYLLAQFDRVRVSEACRVRDHEQPLFACLHGAVLLLRGFWQFVCYCPPP